MRVISGSLKGKEYLRLPKNSRPTKSILKEALLMTLLSHKKKKAQSLYCFADICCGSGAIGIEFISSGYESAILMDIDIRPAYENFSSLGIEDQIELYRRDFRKIRPNMECFEKLGKSDIFFDPPYHFWKDKKFANDVKSQFDTISPLSLIIEHPVDIDVDFSFDELEFLWKKSFGDSALSFFCRRENDN